MREWFATLCVLPVGNQSNPVFGAADGLADVVRLAFVMHTEF
jgi:hypothetical protein